MASKDYKFTGFAYWPKLQRPDEYAGVERWTIQLAMDDETKETFKESGSRLQPKDQEYGTTIALKKTVNPPSGWNGEWGNVPITYQDNRDDDLMIGNGSKVECRVSVYDTSMGKGTRLVSVKVIDLIPFNTEEAPENDPKDIKESEGKEEAKDNEEKAPW